MRVMHCIWRLGTGGAETQLLQLGRTLARRGTEVFVVTAFSGTLDPLLEGSGIASERVPIAHKYDLRVIARIAEGMKRIRPDVVQTWLTQMDIVAGAAALWKRVPWIVSERSSARAYPPSALHFARRFAGARANAIVANSRGGAEYWRRAVRAERLHVIPNIVAGDVARVAAKRERELIVVAGRLTREKNLPTLLRALAIVFRQRNARAVFCGDGPLRPLLEQMSRELHHGDRVIFAGSVGNVPEWLERAAVSVTVSSFEGSSNVVLESIAAGAPLVCSAIDAHREVVDETSARFVDGTSPQSVAAGILDALSDRDAAEARAVRARAALASRAADAVAAQYESLYESVSRRNG